MKHAHDRLFSAGAKAQFAADKKAAKAKRDAMTAEEEHKSAALAKKTAAEKLDAAATKLKGIMKEIAMGSGDATVLTKLAQKAQEAKSNVVAAKAAKRAAAQTLAEKTQALAIVKAKAGEKEEAAKEENENNASSLAQLALLKLPETEIRARQAALELQSLKKQYLGLRDTKKKIIKPSEKFRNIFNFEWDETEDTAREERNPLYQKPVEPQLLFGRGYRAGVDIREQRKTNNFYEELVKRRTEKFGDEAGKFISKSASKPAWMSRDLSVADDKTGPVTHW